MAKPRKPRDLGTPTVIVRYIPTTPELVEQTRKNFADALDRMYREVYGMRLVKIDWGEKPEGYGQEYVLHPDI